MLYLLLRSAVAANLWPQPVTYKAGTQFLALKPSELTFHCSCQGDHFDELLSVYRRFYNMTGQRVLSLSLKDCALVPAIDNEQYQIVVDTTRMEIVA
jgi:hypothetical protein